jgi:adenylate cyclase
VGSAQSRYLSPLAREPPCWVSRQSTVFEMEVERKFLVQEAPKLDDAPADEIDQGYLAIGSDGEVRLRRKGERLLLTAKRGGGLSREEGEVELDRDAFKELWPLTEGRRLHKRRYLLPLGDLEIEIDVYAGDLEGLVVAEIEFPSEDAARAFEPPEWLGEDVTGDPRYLNETLATEGAPHG